MSQEVANLIIDLAETQHGVVSYAQLLDLGLSADAIAERARAGWLHRIHKGVYAVGRRELTLRGRWMAAILAVGSTALLSHRHGGMLRDLCSPGSGPIHVTVPGGGGRLHRRGITVHRSTTLSPRPPEVIDSIPVTAVGRTLIDIAAMSPRRVVERAFDEAERQRLLDLAELQSELAANGHRRGTGTVRAILAEHLVGSTLTRNELEEAFLACCARAGVPMPEEVNADIVLPDGGPPVQGDFTWWTRRLVIETDGFASHATRRGMTRDRQKARRLRRAGWQVESFTWDEVMLQPRAVEVELPSFF
jgi:hypothetical protein